MSAQDNLMSWRAKRGNLRVTAAAYSQYTAAGTTSYQYDPSGNMTDDGQFDYSYDPQNRLVLVHKSRTLPPVSISQALESPLTYTTDGDGPWQVDQGGGYGDWESVYSNDLAAEQSNWLQTTVEGEGSFSFWWKAVSSDTGSALTFWIDGQTRAALYGDQNTWQQKTYTITGSGPHTVKWTFSQQSQEYSAWGCVDRVEWSGPLPQDPPATDWRELVYVYDAAGRRVEKKYNNVTVLKYVYDGDHCIAEYDAFGHLRRKYIYGPAVDEPVCMIEAGGTYAGTYYYHFDGLGSVVALTNASGNTVQVYEYDVYGRVGATDASHPNRILFTGREYDQETGLYYYRARYYNPQIGRFLQTDPIGYSNGMNWYAYCGNGPTTRSDPRGLAWEDPSIRIVFYDGGDPGGVDSSIATGGDLARAADDPYFDVAIDLRKYRVAAFFKYLSTGEKLLDIIMAQMPVDKITGKKIYDRTQVTIEGVWIFDHGNSYGEATLHADTGPFNSVFADLGAALNASHGAGAPIHLRGCQTAKEFSDLPSGSVIKAAAKASGHAVTGANGDVHWDNGPSWGRDNGPKYYCVDGYSIAIPTFNEDGSAGTPWVHAYCYWSMTWIYDKCLTGADWPNCHQGSHPVWEKPTRLY